MFDSSGKLPSSLLKGNVNQLGDFDQCISVEGRYGNERTNYDIYGKYCLVSIDITLPQTMQEIDDLIHSYYVIRSKLTDVSSTYRIEVCSLEVIKRLSLMTEFQIPISIDSV